MLEKIVSGGQTGTDRAGLVAAKEQGFETGGWAPKGWRTTDGPDYSLAELGLIQSDASGYRERTEQNVVDSDATLIFSQNLESAGTKLTIKLAKKHNKPLKIVRFDGYQKLMTASIVVWLHEMEIETLNIAGNSEKSAPGIYEEAKKFISYVLHDYKEE